MLLKSVTEILKINDLACLTLSLRRNVNWCYYICDLDVAGWPSRTFIRYGPSVTLLVIRICWYISVWGVFGNKSMRFNHAIYIYCFAIFYECVMFIYKVSFDTKSRYSNWTCQFSNYNFTFIIRPNFNCVKHSWLTMQVLNERIVLFSQEFI